MALLTVSLIRCAVEGTRKPVGNTECIWKIHLNWSCTSHKCTMTIHSFKVCFSFFLHLKKVSLISFNLYLFRCRLFPTGLLKTWSPKNSDSYLLTKLFPAVAAPCFDLKCFHCLIGCKDACRRIRKGIWYICKWWYFYSQSVNSKPSSPSCLQ